MVESANIGHWPMNDPSTRETTTLGLFSSAIGRHPGSMCRAQNWLKVR